MEIPRGLPGDDPLERWVCSGQDAPRYFYRGTSMSPLLRFGDILHFDPLKDGALHCGDVILYRPCSEGPVTVHRVISLASTGVKTRGDNNSTPDPYLVDPQDILGVVRYGRRGKKIFRVHGGPIGRMVGAAMQFRRGLLSCVRGLLRGPYHWLSNRGFLKALAARGVRFKVVSFTRGDGKELQLFVAGIPVGLLKPRQSRWEIRPPFKLLVDETALPQNNSADDTDSEGYPPRGG